MRTVVISQPTYLPWSGYFRIMKEADVYVIMDNVQFEPRSWQCRNRIKNPGKTVWLTIPTIHRGRCKISEVEIDNSQSWQRQHWLTIKTSYGKAPYFTTYSDFLKSVYERNWINLVSLNVHLLRYLASQVGLSPLFVQASKMSLEGKRTDLLLEICQKFGADRYVSSIGAKGYMTEDGAKEIFAKAGIKVEFLKFRSSAYPQLFGPFVPDLSVLDCLLNCGVECSKFIFEESACTFESLN